MFANFSIFPSRFFFLPVCFWFERLHVLMSGFFFLRFFLPHQKPPTYASNKKRQQRLGNGANVDSCLRMIAVPASVIRYWKLVNYFLSAAIELAAPDASGCSSASTETRWSKITGTCRLSHVGHVLGMKNGYFRL